MQDIIYPMLADDNSFPDDCALKRWSDLLKDAWDSYGPGIDTALHYERQLAEVGFVDIGTVREKWPTNRWPRDKKYKQIGKDFFPFLFGLCRVRVARPNVPVTHASRANPSTKQASGTWRTSSPRSRH